MSNILPVSSILPVAKKVAPWYALAIGVWTPVKTVYDWGEHRGLVTVPWYAALLIAFKVAGFAAFLLAVVFISLLPTAYFVLIMYVFVVSIWKAIRGQDKIPDEQIEKVVNWILWLLLGGVGGVFWVYLLTSSPWENPFKQAPDYHDWRVWFLGAFGAAFLAFTYVKWGKQVIADLKEIMAAIKPDTKSQTS